VVSLIAGVLAACVTALNLVLAIRNYLRDRRPPAPHPLEPALRDIAAAVREWGV
jgi:hypothetical protein